PLFPETVRRRAGLVRHAVHHLLRSRDPGALKFDRCAATDGPYFVAGLGPSFWSALLQALDPENLPGWTPATAAGLARLRLADWPAHARPGTIYTRVAQLYARWRAAAPALAPLPPGPLPAPGP